MILQTWVFQTKPFCFKFTASEVTGLNKLNFIGTECSFVDFLVAQFKISALLKQAGYLKLLDHNSHLHELVECKSIYFLQKLMHSTPVFAWKLTGRL